MKLLVKDILNLNHAQLLMGDQKTVLQNFSIDSRTIAKGEVFLAIRGKNYDGNAFYQQVYEKGSKIWILDRLNKDLDLNQYPDCTIILVENTVTFMKEVASYIRNSITIPIIAITGSVGKTSTKELIASVLKQKYKVLKTAKNLNNEIGLPLTIMGLKDEEVLVLEMGMNHFHEISALSKIAKPDIAVITNIGTAHIGFLGSKENILKAKMEIMDGMNKDGTIIINNDSPLLKNYADFKVEKVLRFSIYEHSDYQAKNIDNKQNKTSYQVNGISITTPIMGEAFIYNSQVAYIIGNILGLTNDEIKEGIKQFKPVGNRMKIEMIKKMTIINDTYNANLEAMQSALDYLQKCEGKRKIAVLGDILELADFSKEIHEKLGALVVEKKIDLLYLTGDEAKYIMSGALKSGMNKDKIKYCTKEKIANYLYENQQDQDVVLFKASNCINLGEIINILRRK